MEWFECMPFFFYLTWLSSIKDLNVIRIDAYPNHRFLSFVLRSGLDIFIAYVFVCVHERACVYRLSIWILKIHSDLWLRPNYAALTHSDRKGSFQMSETGNTWWGEQQRPGYSSLLTHKQELGKKKKQKTLVDRGLSSTRFHTCIFNQDYISQRSVTAHKCSRPFILEMYQR